MLIAITDPLHALSLARTALSDPHALPSNIDFDPNPNLTGESADSAQVEYAIAEIDYAIGGMYFEPFDDPAGEAGVTLANLDRLLASVAEGLDESGSFEVAAGKIREAVDHLTGARMLLASTRG